MNQTPEQTTETAEKNEQNTSIEWKSFPKEIGEIIESNLEEGVEASLMNNHIIEAALKAGLDPKATFCRVFLELMKLKMARARILEMKASLSANELPKFMIEEINANINATEE